MGGGEVAILAECCPRLSGKIDPLGEAGGYAAWAWVVQEGGQHQW